MSFDTQLDGQTPIDDISGLIDKSITNTAELNAAEAENIRKAVLLYLAAKPSSKQAPFDFNWSKRLHTQMFGDVWDWAGTIRSSELNMGVKPHAIETDLYNLFEDLHVWNETCMPVIEQAVRLHHRAVVIHPFINGNGRWSRMLANIWLKLRVEKVVIWPESTIGTQSKIRSAYLDALRVADEGDLQPLVELHQQYQE